MDSDLEHFEDEDFDYNEKLGSQSNMTRVLLTGGSGFVASHVLKILLDRGHSVVTTVRSQAKADHIKSTYYDVPSYRLDFAIVGDISSDHAYDEVMRLDPPFEAVIHTASPFQLWGDDIKRTFLDPAILGTTQLLEAIRSHAPTVKRVVITSSLGTVGKPVDSTYIYSDKDWVEVSEELAYSSPYAGYLASKVYAEKAAWDFVEIEKPHFTVTTILPGYILGPVVHEVGSLDTIMTSGNLLRDFLLGRYKERIEVSPIGRFADVRDTAMAHVRSIEVEEAGGKRFLVGSGTYSNREVATILWKNFPALRHKLPGPEVTSGGYPANGVVRYDVEPSKKILGLTYETLENTIVSMTGSLIGLYKE